MGESKIPIFAYVDESGNTGKNIFDPAQPNFYTAALVTRGDFDAIWGERVRVIARQTGAEAIHANRLGLGRLEEIAGPLFKLVQTSKAHFFLSRVEKKYLLATKMFDVLFDSGENAAVAWHNYNVRPLKIILAFKLAMVIDEKTAREFWSALLMPTEEDAIKALPPICESLKSRLTLIPDERSRQILGEGLDWVIKHPDCIQLATESKLAKQGHFPNLVAFANLLQGLQHFSQLWNKKIARITHDHQSEVGKTIQFWHERFANAASDDIIEWAGERYSLQWAPGSRLIMTHDEESPGIQIADVALWLFAQALNCKDLPPGCTSILGLVLERGWHNDFSFDGVHRHMMEKWGEVFFGPIDEDKLQTARKVIDRAEDRRKASMAQYEADGIVPFMRGLPKDQERVANDRQSVSKQISQS
jgi:Protein of unknown function (DUF3800)